MPFLRRSLPPAVKAVALPSGERRLAWALTPSGEPVVATDLALLLPSGERLAWPSVERASWQPPLLVVLEVAQVEGSGARHVVEIAGESELPQVVRTRVTASVAWSSHERLAAGGVRIVARRVPGSDALTWQLVYDRGTPLDDPLVRARCEALLEAARRSIG